MQNCLCILILAAIILVYFYSRRDDSQLDVPTCTLHYTNWCIYCKKMKPVWEMVKRNNTADMVFLEVDEDLTPTAGISGYPTIILSRDGKKYKYPGGSQYDKLVSWLNNPY